MAFPGVCGVWPAEAAAAAQRSRGTSGTGARASAGQSRPSAPGGGCVTAAPTPRPPRLGGPCGAQAAPRTHKPPDLVVLLLTRRSTTARAVSPPQSPALLLHPAKTVKSTDGEPSQEYNLCRKRGLDIYGAGSNPIALTPSSPPSAPQPAPPGEARSRGGGSLAKGKFALYPKFPGLFSVLKTQLLPLPKLLVYRRRYLSQGFPCFPRRRSFRSPSPARAGRALGCCRLPRSTEPLPTLAYGEPATATPRRLITPTPDSRSASRSWERGCPCVLQSRGKGDIAQVTLSLTGGTGSSFRISRMHLLPFARV